MGCSPSSTPISTENQCLVSKGGTTGLNDFCVEGNNANNPYRTEYCGKISSAGEWVSVTPPLNENCAYGCSTLPIQCFGSKCVNGNSGWGATCERVSFTGNPVECCFNDFNCNTGTVELCFSDSTRQNTCSDGNNGEPNHRSIVGTDCQDVIFNYCTGTGDNSTEWLNRWFGPTGMTGTCSYAIKRNLYRNSFPCGPVIEPIGGICNIPPPLPYDSEGFFWAQSLISAAMEKYNLQGFNLGVSVGDVGYTPWQEIIYDLCCKYPGICQDGLQKVCSARTADRISRNPKTAQWCGCHLPIEEYEDYAAKYNIPPQCTSICNRVDTIPITGINGNPITCTQNVCIIDDITVNVISSQVAGGIAFSQVCANCPAGGCSCIISNATVDVVNSTIGGVLIPISEGCGSLNCQQTNPGKIGPNTIPTPCGVGAYNPFETYDVNYSNAQATANKNSWLWTIVIIIVFLIIVFLAVYFFSGSKKAQEKPKKKSSDVPTVGPEILGYDGRVAIETRVQNPQYIPKIIHKKEGKFLSSKPEVENMDFLT